MNIEQIKKYLELAEKATPGPWQANLGKVFTPDDVWESGTEPNGVFIIASRTMGPAMAKALIIATDNLKTVRAAWLNGLVQADVGNGVDQALADIEKILSGGGE